MTATILWPSKSVAGSLFLRAASSIGALKRIKLRSYRQMSAEQFLNSERVKEPDVALELNRGEAFFDTFSVPGMSRSDLQKLLESEIGALSPAAVEETQIVPARSEVGQGYALLHIRKDLVRALETKARKLGVRNLYLTSEDATHVSFEAPTFTQQARVSGKLTGLACVLILAGLWSGLSTYAAREEALAELASVREQSLRAVVIARNEVSAEVSAFEQFAERKPAKTSPQGVLSRLADLTIATPGATWWSELHMASDEISVSVVSNDAGASLQELSTAYPQHQVRFNGAVADLSEGRQSFTIVISEVAGD